VAEVILVLIKKKSVDRTKIIQILLRNDVTNDNMNNLEIILFSIAQFVIC